MNRKRILTQWSLLLFVLLATFAGCSKDDNEPIQLYYSIYNDKSNPVEDNRVSLLFPTTDKTQLIIFGGDGSYAINNSDEAVVNVAMESKQMNITPLSTGDAIVTITDKSGNSYLLNVEVGYRENVLIVNKQDVIVIGDKLSEVQKTEIQQKAILTLPVKVNGGFKLVYNEGKQINRGQAFIYKDNYGGEAIESLFEFKRVEKEIDGVVSKFPAYVITIDGKQREFVLNKYVAPRPKSDMMVTWALYEILTEQFKAEYPDVEFVYTQQRIK